MHPQDTRTTATRLGAAFFAETAAATAQWLALCLWLHSSSVDCARAAIVRTNSAGSGLKQLHWPEGFRAECPQ